MRILSFVIAAAAFPLAFFGGIIASVLASGEKTSTFGEVVAGVVVSVTIVLGGIAISAILEELANIKDRLK